MAGNVQISPSMRRLINLGCGARFHQDWTNLDFNPINSSVKQCDLREGIPYPDQYFDVVYHSHILEHFPKLMGVHLLTECHRVLKRDGIIRIAVPDLEKIATLYLQALELALQGEHQWSRRYDWILLEMYDQTVRERSGGEMASYLSQEIVPEEKFIISRLGVEAAKFIQKDKSETQPINKARDKWKWFRRMRRFIQSSSELREWLLSRLLKDEYELLNIGRFRRSGEIHQWMYDRFSLSKLLLEAGFTQIKVVGPVESRILNWSNYCLDTEQDGSVSKPDSLFIEAIKQ